MADIFDVEAASLGFKAVLKDTVIDPEIVDTIIIAARALGVLPPSQPGQHEKVVLIVNSVLIGLVMYVAFSKRNTAPLLPLIQGLLANYEIVSEDQGTAPGSEAVH